MTKVYNVGDIVWFYHDKHEGNLSSGKIIHQFEINNNIQYVIEIETCIDPIYIVRDWLTLSPSKNKPIGLWYQIFIDLKKVKKEKC